MYIGGDFVWSKSGNVDYFKSDKVFNKFLRIGKSLLFGYVIFIKKLVSKLPYCITPGKIIP